MRLDLRSQFFPNYIYYYSQKSIAMKIQWDCKTLQSNNHQKSDPEKCRSNIF